MLAYFELHAELSVKILFVCLGNICRSPAAEGVFLHLANEAGRGSEFTVDSAGILDFHKGKPADSRMRDHAKRRGIELTSRSRPVVADDFERFDLIIAMDKRNLRDLEALNPKSKHQHKLVLMSAYFTKSKLVEVPDPYYGGPEGFEVVLDLVTEGSLGLLEKTRR
jgi:protein-tyrosine phosphatase